MRSPYEHRSCEHPSSGSGRSRATRDSWRRDRTRGARSNGPRSKATEVADASAVRAAKEAEVRERLKAGELGLDIYRMCEKLARLGLVYRDHSAEE